MGLAIQQFVEQYYQLRGIVPKRTPKNTMQNADRYLLWCAENNVNPLIFARYRFDQARAAGRKHAVPMRSLRSPKSLKVWRDFAADKSHAEWHEQKLTSEMLTPNEDRVQALIEKPTRAQELLRTDYKLRDKAQLCAIEARYTGGYDPRSKVCPSCEIKHHCLLALNKTHGFDVGALRVGMLQRLPLPVAEIVRKTRAKK